MKGRQGDITGINLPTITLDADRQKLSWAKMGTVDNKTPRTRKSVVNGMGLMVEV